MIDGREPMTLAGTGRHLTELELRAWTRFLDAGRLLEEVLARDLSHNHNMPHSEYEVLVRLDGAGGSMRMSMLADQVVSSAQKLTHTANRLEKRGWITRQPDKHDGRGLVAALLPAGRQALTDAAEPHAELIKQFLTTEMSDVEMERLGNVMERISSHLRLHRRGEPCPRCDARGE